MSSKQNYLNCVIYEKVNGVLEDTHRISYILPPAEAAVHYSVFLEKNDGSTLHMACGDRPIEEPPVPITKEIAKHLRGMIQSTASNVELLLAAFLKQWRETAVREKSGRKEKEPIVLVDFLRQHGWIPSRIGYRLVRKRLESRLMDSGFVVQQRRRKSDRLLVGVWSKAS